MNDYSEEYRKSLEIKNTKYKVLFDTRVSCQKAEVSIIVPVFGEHEYLNKLLRSLIECFDASISQEIILVDDDPNTDISSIFLDCKHELKNLVGIKNKENIGFSLSCNNGIREAKGTYLVFINSDIEMLNPAWLSKMMSCFKSDNKIGAVSGMLLSPRGTIQYAGSTLTEDDFNHPYFDHKHYYLDYPESFPLANRRFYAESFCGAFVIVLASAIKSVGDFDLRFSYGYGFEDSDLAMRLAKQGYRHMVCGDAKAIHHGSISFGKEIHQSMRKNINGLHFYEKWKDELSTNKEYKKIQNLNKKERQRALIVAHGFPPYDIAGSEVYTYHLVRELSQLMDVFCVYAYRYPDSEKLRPGQIVYDRKLGDAHVFKMASKYRHTDNYFYNVGDVGGRDIFKPEFVRLLREIDPDIVHFQHTNFLSTNMVQWTKMHSSAKAVYTLHEFLPICPHNGQLVTRSMELCEASHPAKCVGCFPDRKTGEIIRRASIYEKNIKQSADLLIAPSNFLKQKYLEWGVNPEKIIYSDNGFKHFTERKKDPRDFLTKKTLRFAFLGNITPFKGIDVLLAAFEKKIEGAELYIHGICKNADIMALIEKSCLNDWVQFKGHYDPDNLESVLSQTDVVIVPSIWWENSPLVIHEARLFGLPVIASDIGGMKELIDRLGGIPFRRADSDDLREVIENVCFNRKRLNEICKMNPTIKTIQDNALELASLYRGLLENHC